MVDSDNSRSMHSSSTGGGHEEEEEEYMNISQSESIPTFLNQPTSQFGSSESNPNSDHHQSSVLLSHYYQNHQPPFFDLLSNNYLQLEPFSQYSNQTNPNPNIMLNIDPFHQSREGLAKYCSDELRNYSTSETTQSVFASHELGGTSSNITNSTQVARNSKKRSRASRRPPTTVLTTDTSNFRAMVQEFTGIPAPPFSTSSSSSRISNRFDPFGSAMMMRSNHNNINPSYPLRPSPLKMNQSSSSLPFLNNNMGNNFQISTDHNHQGFPKINSHLVNIQNPGVTFQSYPSDLNQRGLTSLEAEMNMSNHIIGYVNTNPDRGLILGQVNSDDQGNTLLHVNEDQ